MRYARIVADYLGTKHTELIVTEEEMFDAIPDVIYAIESYDTTTVRASIGNYLLGKYIAANSEAKVVLNGDGSDELFGGYLYMRECPDSIEFDKETRRLLKDIHYFDVLRSDKSISSNGLEPRTPFLDKALIQYILSLPLDIRDMSNICRREEKEIYKLKHSTTLLEGENRERLKIEKLLLRIAFCNTKLLPDDILWRRKEAFSDGVSGKDKPFYQILQSRCADKMNKKHISSEDNLEKKYLANLETEKMYYKSLYDEFYKNSDILPYFWMPKYMSNVTDPSAKTLEIY